MAKRQATAGQLLVNEILPQDMRDYARVLDKKGLAALLSEIAEKHPDKYREISHKLGKIGRMSAYTSGGNSFGLEHMRRSASSIKRRLELQKPLNALLDDDNISDNDRETQIIKLIGKLTGAQQEEIYQESVKENNPLAHQLSGAGRGNKMNLASLRGSDGLYQDHHSNIIPVPVLRSYSQGLSPAEYWAGTYGARLGVMATKFCLAAGTPVLRADHTPCAIESLKVGEQVMTIDDDGLMIPTTVTAVMHTGAKKCVSYGFDNGIDGVPISVVATPEHKACFARSNYSVAEYQMLPLGAIRADNVYAVSPSGYLDPESGTLTQLPISRLHKPIGAYIVGVKSTYDISVSHPSHRFVLANYLIVSNSTQDAGFLCLDQDTQVRMADWTTKPISEIVVGDAVLGANTAGKTFPVKVTAVFDNGLRALNRYKFRYGKSRSEFVEITATAQHNVLGEHLRRRRRRPEKKLRIEITQDKFPLGDFENRAVSWHALIPSQGFKCSSGRHEPLAGIIGFLIAEGGLTTNHVGLSCGDPTLLLAARRYARQHGFSIRKKKGTEYEYSYFDNRKLPATGAVGGGIAIGSFRNRLKKRLKSLALLGKLAPDKTIPSEVDGWNNTSVANLLRWLFAGDGSLSASNNSSTPTITLGMTAGPVVERAKFLLASRFGIYGQICVSNTAGRLIGAGPYKANYDTVVLSISDRESVLKFARLIGFVDGNKQRRLEELVEKIEPCGRRDRFLFHFVSAEACGDGQTFDIEVDHPDHLFVLANGAIVSNSKQLNQISHRSLITDLDHDGEPDTLVGLPVDINDDESEGSLLATKAGPYERNTILTPKVLKDLRKRGIARLLVRSPAVSGTADGGVYARDAGVREFGRLPVRGENIGLAAAQALSEPISQGQLCLAEGTLVRMSDWSVAPIEKIRPGQYVMGADLHGTLRPARVSRVYDNGERDCLRTVFREAKTKQLIELVSTGDHKVPAKTRSWALPTEKIDYGMFPVAHRCVGFSSPLPTRVDNPVGIYEPFSLLFGLLLGDGCYTKSVHGVHWSCYEPDLVAEVVPYLNSLGLCATKLKGHEGYYRISQLADGPGHRDDVTGQYLPGLRNPALKWLTERDLHEKYSYEKSIPDEVWSWDADSVAALLGGLFATDGSVYAPRGRKGNLYISYGSTSAALTRRIKELLAVRFAVFSSSVDKATNNRKRPCYGITITRVEQVRRFQRAIKIPGRKGNMLASYVANMLPDNSAEYFHRQSQTAVGKLPTFDIEVENQDHLFVLANGLIVSNSMKHSGGVAGETKVMSGFDWVNSLVQVPKTFKGGAAHVTLDGTVQDVSEAPAGGHYVTVDGVRHYVGSGYALKVKKGDKVEAGDVISEGIPDPSQITKYKGIGEGRRYFIDAFRTAMKESNMRGHRRNIELLSRGLINHVRLTDEIGDFAPDDVVPYSSFAAVYKPRDGFSQVQPTRGLGQYLERPYLHYSIGTKVRPSMLKDFKEFGINAIDVHRDEPPFQPEMIRGMANLQHDPDWMTRMLGSGLKGSLLKGVHRGSTSDATGTSFVPGRARAVDFGHVGKVITPEDPDYGRPT